MHIVSALQKFQKLLGLDLFLPILGMVPRGGSNQPDGSGDFQFAGRLDGLPERKKRRFEEPVDIEILRGVWSLVEPGLALDSLSVSRARLWFERRVS